MVCEGEDTGWTCDKCKKPILGGEPCYGLVANSETKTTRHWKCHTPIEQVFGQLRKDIADTKRRVDEWASDRYRK